MHRALIVPIAVAVVFGCGWAALAQTAVLDELVPWPLLSAGVWVETLPLTDKPAESISGSRKWTSTGVDAVRFGLVPIGTSQDPGVSFVFLQDATPQIVVDVDNDEDLANDGIVATREQIDSRSYTWFVTVVGEFKDGGSIVRFPLRISIIALYSYDSDDYVVGYSAFCQRRGVLELDGASVPIAVTSLRTDGTYDVSQLVVAVDGDSDGRIDSLPGSPEAFGPGEDIQIGAMRYRATSVSAWGETLSVEPVGPAPARPRIAKGEPAPVFSTVSLAGQRLNLSMFEGQVVVLYFLPSLSAGDCAACAADNPYVERLTSIHAAVRSLDGVVVIAVVPSETTADKLSALPSTGIHTVADPALASLYRRTYGAIVVAPDGTIAAMDEAWATFRCGRPHGEFDELRSAEVSIVAQHLLEEDQR